MAEPWTHRDERGNELTVGTAEDCDGTCWLRVERPEGVTGKWAPSALVDGLDIPEVTNAMWRAAGQEPPVMLGRPELPADGSSAEVAGFRLWSGGGKVQYEADRTGELAPHAARQLAAAIVALADSVHAEPDPADVEELAHAIRLELYPDSDRAGLRPSESDRQAARAALRWMKARAVPGA